MLFENQTSKLLSAVRPEHLVDCSSTRWYDVLHQTSELITNVYRTLGFLYYSIMLGEPIKVWSGAIDRKLISCLSATSAANLVIYVVLPVERRGLVASLLPVLRGSMAIVGSRIVLNVRGVLTKGSDHSSNLSTMSFRTPIPYKVASQTSSGTLFSDSPPTIMMSPINVRAPTRTTSTFQTTTSSTWTQGEVWTSLAAPSIYQSLLYVPPRNNLSSCFTYLCICTSIYFPRLEL